MPQNIFAQGEGGQEGGTLIGTETEYADERAVLVVVGVEVPGVVNRASQMRGYSKSPADSHLVAGGANADAAVPVQPERRAPALPALVALAPVEVADQQQPPAHPPRRQVRSAFADLSLEALEGYTTGAAATVGDSALGGRIAPGLRADLTILAEDPVLVDADNLPDLPVRMTIVDGEIVYAADG